MNGAVSAYLVYNFFKVIQLYIIPYIDVISNTKNKKQPVSLVIMSVVFCLFVCFISKMQIMNLEGEVKRTWDKQG